MSQGRPRDADSLQSQIAAAVWDAREKGGRRPTIVRVATLRDAFDVPSARVAGILWNLWQQGRIARWGPGAYYAPQHLPRPEVP